jgi:hypothetical protein
MPALQKAIAERAKETSAPVADNRGLFGLVVEAGGFTREHHRSARGCGGDAPEECGKNLHPQLRLAMRTAREFPEI